MTEHGIEQLSDAPGAAWLRDYAMLALRVNRRLTEGSGSTLLIYRGPDSWAVAAGREEPPPAARLVEDAERLLADVPFEGARAAWLRAQVRALRAVARGAAGAEAPLAAFAGECLGIEAGPVPESVFDEAHAQLDAALPRGPGTTAERLRAWQDTHRLPPERIGLLPDLVRRAVAETRARTARIVPLPADEEVGCTVVPEAHFLGAGHYEGGGRSTIFVNGGLPWNLADLLYVVAHEGHPGHIAESLLKEHAPDQEVRFLLSPPFVLSEGLGLCAQEIAFPGDEAQEWLTRTVLAEQGIRPDSSDFAAIHRARTALWGTWANAAFLAAEGRPQGEVRDCLTRWGLLTDEEVAAALKSVTSPGMNAYVLGYYYGWRLVDTWLARAAPGPEREARVRRLLTEPLLPADLADA
ncbi:hypothetical protein [Streptomyces sp. MP131-18]|uniref:hypothetical protein n=1 Tax=Streptomyces sp. MP131-18 TaxID=1857892 RepID=UPI0009D096FD|nr:hypothetical protein [Streptomyces sp. MP131-18]ONK14531.1 hypothetical protein STBA_53160 [Streptomyces sp. MP131-18]